MNTQLRLVTSMAGVLIVVPFVTGCFAPNEDPLAAASAAAQIAQALEGAATDGEVAEALASVIVSLTPTELASAVNLVAGLGWSLEDARAAQELLGRIADAGPEALLNVEIDDPHASPESIQQALADAGIEASVEQVVLLQQLFAAFGGVAGG